MLISKAFERGSGLLVVKFNCFPGAERKETYRRDTCTSQPTRWCIKSLLRKQLIQQQTFQLEDDYDACNSRRAGPPFACDSTTFRHKERTYVPNSKPYNRIRRLFLDILR